MSVFSFTQLPREFNSWSHFLTSDYKTHKLCKSKEREFHQLYENKMLEYIAPISPLSKNCKVCSYPLPPFVITAKPHYGNYQFRFLNSDTGTRRQVVFEDHKQYGLNKNNGTCLFAPVLPFYSHREEIDQIAKLGEEKWNESVRSIYGRFREFIEPVRQPPARERYKLYLTSKQWHEKSLVVKQRDQYRCVACHSTGGLQVHHKTYERWGDEKFDDLMTVCRACHGRIHGLYPV